MRQKKVPMILQMEAVECGAACLAMILGYYGKNIPLEELRVACGVTRDGSKAKYILRAARQYGLSAKGYSLELEDLDKVNYPAIIHWNFEHFVVLEKIKGDKVYLLDPAVGPRIISIEELDLCFTGITLVFETTEDFQRTRRVKKDRTYIRTHFEHNPGAYSYMIIAGLFLLIPGMCLPLFTKIFIDYVLIKNNKEWLQGMVVCMMGLLSLQVILQVLKNRVLNRLQIKIAMSSSLKFFTHLMKLPLNFFNQRYTGDLVGRMDSNDDIAEVVAREFPQSVVNVILSMSYLGVMFAYDTVLAWTLFGMTLIQLILLQWIGYKHKLLSQKWAIDRGKLSGVITSGIYMIETLKATGGEENFLEKLMGYGTKVINTEQEIGRMMIWLRNIPKFLTALSSFLILIIGGERILQGEMTAGTLVAFQSLAISFMLPMQQLMGLKERLQNVQGELSRVEDVLHYEQDKKDTYDLVSDTKERLTKKLEGNITLDNLAFGYNPFEAPLIENFNLTIQSGERIAIVGGSGSGKSTISKILAGIYKPWEGVVKFDGYTREQIEPACMSQSVGIVEQNPQLFSGTIKQNVIMWDMSITEESIIRACKDACIHQEIIGRKEGYNAIVKEEGSNLSGGQRQRLEIARALAINPSIMILDEATSALDAVTEHKIDENLRRRGCTCIIIAHRLSTIRDCDKIIVLHKGKIVEVGTHESLKQQNGYYKHLMDIND